LTVRFTGSGYDEDGDIKLYKFDFGDASDGQPQVWEQEESEAYHRYMDEGAYFASLHVKDSRGNWRNGNDDCKVEIDVTSEPTVLGASTTTELPKTGTPAAVALGIVSLTSVGAYLFKRFNIA
jgi:LPXTG-motif cell wall-anchored protein